MMQRARWEIAQAFLDDYGDPEIDKRLCFDVWADRKGLNGSTRHFVWVEVRRLTYQIAAQKRRQTCRGKLMARLSVPVASRNGRANVSTGT